MKKWYQSKTVWANIVSILVLILAEFVAKGIFSNYAEYWAAGIAIGNVLMRFITVEPITVKTGTVNK